MAGRIVGLWAVSRPAGTPPMRPTARLSVKSDRWLPYLSGGLRRMALAIAHALSGISDALKYIAARKMGWGMAAVCEEEIAPPRRQIIGGLDRFREYRNRGRLEFESSRKSASPDAHSEINPYFGPSVVNYHAPRPPRGPLLNGPTGVGCLNSRGRNRGGVRDCPSTRDRLVIRKGAL